jgi:hypothetical protein
MAVRVPLGARLVNFTHDWRPVCLRPCVALFIISELCLVLGAASYVYAVYCTLSVYALHSLASRHVCSRLFVVSS